MSIASSYRTDAPRHTINLASFILNFWRTLLCEFSAGVAVAYE
ncbi:hypothetical protein [Anabaena sp. CCY 9910]